MFCPRCDSPLEEQAAFCGACGALIRPKLGGSTVFETFDSTSANSRQGIPPTIYPALRIPMRKLEPTIVASGEEWSALEEEQAPEEEWPASREEWQVSREAGQVSREAGQVSGEEWQASRGAGQVSREEWQASRGAGQVLREAGQISREAGQASRYGNDEQSARGPVTRDTPAALLPLSYPPRSRKGRKTIVWALVILAIVVVGSTSWVFARGGFRATSSTPATALIAKGQVSFLDGQNDAPGTTDALKIEATGLSNLPEGSKYDAWLIDTANEQVLSLGSLSKSDPTTFALSYPNASSQPQTNLIGAGNKIEVTQEQGDVEAPTGKVMLSATFPPQAFVHIRHLLFKFPTTPNNIGLLPGLLGEIQKVGSLSLLLQNSTISSTKTSVTCVAQAIVNVIEGAQGTNFSPLADNCTRVVGSTETGDGFGILKYLTTTSAHAVLAATQPDTTDTIRLHAKDVETSSTSIKAVVTKVDTDALQLLTNPVPTANQVSDLTSLSDRAYHGFDQNGDGKIDPIVGEAGALTAYTSGHLMATLSLS